MEILYFWLGLSVKFNAFKGIHREWKVFFVSSGLQLVVVPLIGLFYANQIMLSPSRDVLLLVAFAPGGITSALASRALKLDIALSIALTSATTLISLTIIQPFVTPIFIKNFNFTSLGAGSFFYSLGALIIGIAVNNYFPKQAKWLDRFLAIAVFSWVIFHVYSELSESGRLNIDDLIVMSKFHFTVVIFSAVVASSFFGVKRAPLIVIEAGFQNVSLIAALAIPLGLPIIIPLLYGGLMFFSTLIIGVNLALVRRVKPQFISTRLVLHPYRAQALPPLFVLIRPEYKNNIIVREHELVHWKQFKRLGSLGFYLRYFYQLIAYGYDNAPLEKEAREKSCECHENQQDYSRRVHGKKSMTRLEWAAIISLILLGILCLNF